MVGIVVTTVHSVALLIGVWVGALSYDYLDPVLTLMTIFMRFPFDILVEVFFFVAVFYVSIAGILLLARLVLVAVSYGLYQLGSRRLVAIILVFTIAASGLGLGLAMLPAGENEELLDFLLGLCIISALVLLASLLWMAVRYRVGQRRSARALGSDIGLAYSYMTEPGRATVWGERRSDAYLQ